jgi:nitrate/nitrite transporter NarK
MSARGTGRTGRHQVKAHVSAHVRERGLEVLESMGAAALRVLETVCTPAHRPLDGSGRVAAFRGAPLHRAVGKVHGQVSHAGAVGGVLPARQPAEAAPARTAGQLSDLLLFHICSAVSLEGSPVAMRCF